MAKKPTETKFAALTQAEAAYLIGVSPRWLRDHPDVSLPARDVGTGLYDGRELVKLIRKWERDRQQHDAPTSPALERYRSERAKIARIQRMREERRYVPLEPIREFHNKAAARMCSTHERLQRDLDGNARDTAARAYDDMIDDLERLADECFRGLEDQERLEDECDKDN